MSMKDLELATTRATTTIRIAAEAMKNLSAAVVEEGEQVERKLRGIRDEAAAAASTVSGITGGGDSTMGSIASNIEAGVGR